MPILYLFYTPTSNNITYKYTLYSIYTISISISISIFCIERVRRMKHIYPALL